MPNQKAGTSARSRYYKALSKKPVREQQDYYRSAMGVSPPAKQQPDMVRSAKAPANKATPRKTNLSVFKVPNILGDRAKRMRQRTK